MQAEDFNYLEETNNRVGGVYLQGTVVIDQRVMALSLKRVTLDIRKKFFIRVVRYWNRLHHP